MPPAHGLDWMAVTDSTVPVLFRSITVLLRRKRDPKRTVDQLAINIFQFSFANHVLHPLQEKTGSSHYDSYFKGLYRCRLSFPTVPIWSDPSHVSLHISGAEAETHATSLGCTCFVWKLTQMDCLEIGLEPSPRVIAWWSATGFDSLATCKICTPLWGVRILLIHHCYCHPDVMWQWVVGTHQAKENVSKGLSPRAEKTRQRAPMTQTVN